MTATTLVTGDRASQRETAVAALIDPAQHTAVILEGLPDGSNVLDASLTSSHLNLVRIAPGCMCCTGNLVMRVTLNRILRNKPERLLIGVANSDHLDQLRLFLSSAPYDNLLELTADVKTVHPGD